MQANAIQQQRRTAPGCAPISRGNVDGYYSIIPVTVDLDFDGQVRSSIVNFDAQGGFLLQQITVATDPFYPLPAAFPDDVLSLQITDTRRNRQLFSREVGAEIFSRQYSGCAHRLPRPYLILPASDVAVMFRQSDISNTQGPGQRQVTLCLHGWRYRGAGGPDAPINEDFYVYRANPTPGSAETLLIEADHDFVCTQIIGDVAQITDRKLTRQLFEGGGVLDGLFASPVGDLYALQHPYAFSANSRVTVEGDGPVYLVGFKRWLR